MWNANNVKLSVLIVTSHLELELNSVQLILTQLVVDSCSSQTYTLIQLHLYNNVTDQRRNKNASSKGLDQFFERLILPSNEFETQNKNCCCSLTMKVIGISVLGLALGIVGFSVFSVSSYPLHASCQVEWTFGKPCADVQAALKNQMDVWKTNETCGTGQKCLYKFISSTATTLKGTHETPVKHYVDDISYTFSPGDANSCNVQGFSSSQLWYAVLDYGTNYCNIKNLVDGANLQTNDSKFSESTRDAVCTQYSSANCEKY